MEGILPTPGRLLLDNSVQEDEKIGFNDGLTERRVNTMLSDKHDTCVRVREQKVLNI